MLRFAPDLHGDMHLGNLRVALLNHIVATQRKEKLVIRLEDSDQEQINDSKNREILDILNLFGIHYKEEVVYQSNNVKFYRQFALSLLQQKRAFNCFCAPSDEKYDGTCKYLTDEETIDREDPFVVRMKEPDFTISFSDHVQGDASFEPQEMDNFIILTQDKQPTYNFACAIDDILHDTSLIIRDENHLLDTPKQIAIQHALNYAKTIEYAHLPSVKGTHITVKTLLSEGFVPEAIANYLILLSVKTPTDIFSLDEAIEWFKLENISTSPETFDHDKLRLLNREHLKRMDETELSRYVGFADSDIGALAKLYLEEVSTLNELRNKIERLFAPKKIPTKFEKEAKTLKETIANADHFETYDDFTSYLLQRSGLSGENFLKPLALLLTNETNGPELSTLYPYIKNYLGEIVK